MKRIPVAGPWITEHEVACVADAVRTAWYEHADTFNERFERAFRRYIGATHALALPSCTSAIHLSLAALGVGPGDEVIVPDITWIASAAPISYVGAAPVFVDIDPATWCISPAAFARAITPRTRAAIIVDLYGNMPDWPAVLHVARQHDIPIIEDAAEAIGASQRRQRAGSFGRTGVFSFHGSKTLTTGEGGMLVTNDADIYERCLVLRDHGRRPADAWFFNEQVAFKYRMSALQAALGLAQLERIDQLVRRKKAIFEWYRHELRHLNAVTLNPQQPHTRNAYWMVTALLDPRLGITKRLLTDELASRGIDSRPFFHPLSSLPAYSHLAQATQAAARNRHAYALSPWGINLPSGLQLTRDDVVFVCAALNQILAAPSFAHA